MRILIKTTIIWFVKNFVTHILEFGVWEDNMMNAYVRLWGNMKKESGGSSLQSDENFVYMSAHQLVASVSEFGTSEVLSIVWDTSPWYPRNAIRLGCEISVMLQITTEENSCREGEQV